MGDVQFEDTQIAADGKRYKTDDIESANEKIAAGDQPKATEWHQPEEPEQPAPAEEADKPAEGEGQDEDAPEGMSRVQPKRGRQA